jgi:hypothetical protein
MMTIRSGLVVLLKSFMLLLGFQLAMWLACAAIGRQIPVHFLAMATLIFIPLILVYWFAEAAVDLMTPKSNEILGEAPMRFGDLQAIAFSAIGAYVVYTAIQETIYLILYLWQSDTVSPMPPRPDLVAKPIISWIAGLYLLIGAPQVRRWITSVRHAGRSAD